MSKLWPVLQDVIDKATWLSDVAEFWTVDNRQDFIETVTAIRDTMTAIINETQIPLPNKDKQWEK
jgi:hypothetical protein